MDQELFDQLNLVLKSLNLGPVYIDSSTLIIKEAISKARSRALVKPPIVASKLFKDLRPIEDAMLDY